MSRLRVKAAGVLLALLVASMEFTPSLLASRVLAQQDSYSDFLNRLETYLKDALPPESDPVRECEYVAPEGFNASHAERLWRTVSPLVSMGADRENITDALRTASQNGCAEDGILLNVTGTMVEKTGDGGVRVKIPVSSDKPLNYTYCNSTDVRILYETWNETLVKYYSVKSLLALLNVSYRNLETNETLTRLIKPFLNSSVMLGSNAVAQGLSLNVTVPEHSCEVTTIVPEHVREFSVLFPKYRIKVEVLNPVELPNGSSWLVDPNSWRPSFPIGSEVTVTVCAIPNDPNASYPYSDWIKEPLDAIVRVGSCEGFQIIGYDALRLTTSKPWGHFTLKAVETGNRSIVFEAEGNAVFQDGAREHTVPIEVLRMEQPCLTVSILRVNGSTPGYVNLTFRVRNTGGSATEAWFFPFYMDWSNELLDVLPWLWGYGTTIYLGTLPPGGSVDYAYTYLLDSHAIVEIIILYGYPWRRFVSNTYLYLNYSPQWVSWEEYLIAVPEYREAPEHYEKLLVMIPVHDEGLNVTIPGYTCLMRIRIQSLGINTFENMLRSMLNNANMTASFLLGETVEERTIAPLSLTTPVLGIELEAGGKKPGEEASRYVMESVEQLFGDMGIMAEEEVCRLTGVSRSMLRRGILPDGFNISLAYETWVNSSTILLNATQFAAYNHTLSNYIAENNLQAEFKIGWEKLTNATRLTKPVNETGFLTLIYHPLSVKGSGPLKSIQVRNYAGVNADYVMSVQQLSWSALHGKPVWRLYTTPLPVKSMDYNVTLASSLASEGYTYVVRLLYGSNMVAEAVFDLSPEASPFWGCFWEEVRGRIPWILATSTIIILVGFLTGHGTTAAYAGLAVSIVSTITYLVSGTVLNWAEIEQCIDAYSFHNSLADTFRDWSYELSNYTPPKTPGPPQGPPIEVYKPFEPKGPLATLYWNYSQYFRGVANRILEDTVLDLVVGCGVTDFETAMNPNASECARGRATGRIVSAALSFTAFVIATKIASIEAKAANAKTPWKFVSAVKAWVTPAIYDLLETLVKGRRVIAFIARNPGQALQIGKFLLFKGLKAVESVASEAWESAKDKVKELVEKIESGAGRIEDSWERMIERLKSFLGFHDELHNFAKEAGQEEAMGVNTMLDGGEIEVPKQTEILRMLGEMAAKSKEAEKAISTFLELLKKEGKLKDFVNSGLLGEIKELEVNGLKSLQVALEEPNRLEELVAQPELISKAMGALSETKYYEFENRRMTSGGSIWLTGTVDEGLYKVRAEVEGEPVKIWTIEVREEGGTNQITVPEGLRDKLTGREIKKLEICGYVPELHFPKHFSLPSLGESVFLDFVEETIKVGDFNVKGFKLGETVGSPQHGFGITIETDVKSINGGELTLRFYEDGSVRLVSGKNVFEVKNALLEVKQLGEEEIASLELIWKESGEEVESVYPIKTLKLEIGKEYPMDFSVEGKDRTTGLQSEVRKVFGYDDVTKFQKMMEAGEVMARITFEDETSTVTKDPKLVVRTGGEVEKVIKIEFYRPELTPKYTFEDALKYFKEDLKVKDEGLAGKLARNYHEVLGFSAEEVERTGDDNLKGKFGELQAILPFIDKLVDIHYKIKVDGKERILDIVFKDAIVEVKYWNKDTYERHFEDSEGFDELVKQIEDCNKAREQMELEEVFLVFGKKGVISDTKFDEYAKKLRDALGGDTSWLVICYGFKEFEGAYGG